MATAYTSLLGLALPVTGELQGTWGTTVNDSITSLLDTAVAGTTTLSADTDVTLSTTTGAANQARQAILLCSGARTVLRTITAPAQSKIYTVINATTGGFSVKLVGVGPTTGVTIVAGESALVAWNGSDFIKISNTGGAASFTNVTVSGTTTLSGLTASTALALNGSKEVVSVTNTGTGNNVLATSPTLTTPILGAATATSINKVALTAPATAATLTIADGKTLTANNSLTLAGTDATTMTFPTTSASIARTDAGQTFTGTQTFSSNPVLSGGTANGVLYLDGSKVATSGSALTFDGTNLATTGTSSATKFIPTGGTATGNGMYLSAANTLGWSTNGTKQLELDSSGNLGLGVTPSAWSTVASRKAIQLGYIGGAAVFTNATGNTLSSFVHNAYDNGTNWLYAASSVGAARYEMTGANAGSTHAWYVSAGGTAGNAITFTQAMTLDASGNLGIGTSSPDGPLQVSFSNAETSQFNAGAATLYLTNTNTTNNNWAQIFFTDSDGGAAAATFGAQYTDHANDYAALSFATRGASGLSERMRLDSSGNLGLGVTPSAWQSAYKALEVGNSLAMIGGSNAADLYFNAFINSGGSFRYRANDPASAYSLAAGQHRWFTAPSGTAGNPISFTQAMTLDADGRLGIGITNPAYRLDVEISSGPYSARFNNSNSSTNQYNVVLFGQAAAGSAIGYVGTGGSAVSNSAFANNFVVGTQTSNALVFNTADTERARITSGGNLLVGYATDRGFRTSIAASAGATSNISALNLENALDGGVELRFTNSVTTSQGLASILAVVDGTGSGTDEGNLVFKTANSAVNTERARITSGGDLQTFNTFALWPSAAGGAGSYSIKRAATNALTINDDFAGQERLRITSGGDFGIGNNNPQYRLTVDKDTTSALAFFTNSNASAPNGLYVDFSAASPNNATQYFLYCEDSTAQRATIRSNGGLANYQSNNVDLSDSRTKKDIAPAASMWSKIGALEIVTYKYNDQTHDDVNVGVIAQQVEQVEPVWVDSDGFGETPEDGVPLKTVYTKDITFAAIKALQEAMTRIEQLEARVAALEAK